MCPRKRARSAVLALTAAGFVVVWGALPVAADDRPKARVARAEPPLPAAGMKGPGKMAAAVRRQGSVAVDGVLDEEAWSGAPTNGDFWQRMPLEGKPPRFATEFRILYDDAALYVGILARDHDPGAIRSLLTRRDEESASDWVLVGIDSYHDKRTAFVFCVNPAGVQRDFMVFDDTKADGGWNAVWESAARVTDKGWVAELRIPYSQLRFASAIEQSWGLQVVRVVARTNEESSWTPWPQTSSQTVSRFGGLAGIRDIKPSRRLEVLPYTTAGGALVDVDAEDPFSNGLDGRATIGVDVKYGLGSNLTLSGTINPDFGQVEADPSEVNLSAYESFFAEKRPFFLEGTEIFGFTLGQGDGDQAVEKLFYSRRIGAAPHATGEDAYYCVDQPGPDGRSCYYPAYVDEPGLTTIYSAAKLSGKTAGGWSIGVLDAITGEERARVAYDDEEGSRETLAIEPLTNYAMLRLRKDSADGRTVVGGAVTAVNRRLDGTGLDWLLHDQAYTGGLALSHRFAGDLWQVDARVAASYVHGTAEALIETQTSSRRYYQRPDATHLDYDPTRTSLAGAALIWSAGKVDGAHWRASAGGDVRSPGFEVNDMGFQRNADKYVQWVWMQYRDDSPGEVLRNYQVNGDVWGALGRAPLHLSHGFDVNASTTLLNYWGASVGASVNRPRWDSHALRGGPALRADVSSNMWASLTTDGRRMVRGNLNGNAAVNPTNGTWSFTLNPSIVVQARSNLDFAVGPALSSAVVGDQYIDEAGECVWNEASEACDEIIPHYILARMRMLQASLTLRMNYTFSPTLSLQLYAQPFIGAYKFSDYKEADRPDARSYDERFHEFSPAEISIDDDEIYYIDRDRDGAADFAFEGADFSFRELRSNLVVRWEYRPGSNLFLIWSHGRTSDSTDGWFRLGEDLDGLASEAGEHVVMVKLNYWMGV